MEITNYSPVLTEYEKKLPIYVASIGISEHEDNVYRPDGIEDWQILYADKGEGYIKTEGKQVKLTEGSLMIFPPYYPHIYKAASDKWTTMWITYNGIASGCVSDSCASIVNTPDCEEFKRLFAELIEADNKENSINETSIIMYKILLLARNMFQQSDNNIKSGKMSEVIDYISRNFAGQPEINTLADIAGVSVGHFCRMFKAYSGKRPFEYINALRVKRAKTLLRYDINMSVSDISTAVGFSSVSYFIKIFKKSEGTTPNKYKNEITKLSLI